MFQPPKNVCEVDHNFQYMANIKLQMFKEFAEEVLGKKAFERIQNAQELKIAIEKESILKKLDSLLNNGGAHFQTLGLSLDIFRLRPEILSILIINDEEFYYKLNENFIKQAEDSNREGPFNSFEVDSIHYYDLMNDQLYFDILSNTELPIVPPGAACLKLGRDFMLKHYINQAT
ncbi:MAG: hypothetical protein DSY46_00815 [Hydrogenimonas sp.]|nr:MAG: hypothetical protein DSY46_00815 [Hydrogenimonas sp.]